MPRQCPICATPIPARPPHQRGRYRVFCSTRCRGLAPVARKLLVEAGRLTAPAPLAVA